MRRQKFTRHLTAAVTATAMLGAVYAGPAVAEENRVPPRGDSATTPFDMDAALRQLRSAAAGNPAAEAAVDRLLAERPQIPGAADVALPAQVFQIPANSDIGRTGAAPGVHGSGIALGINGFQFGFFGGPGTIAPNQDGFHYRRATIDFPSLGAVYN